MTREEALELFCKSIDGRAASVADMFYAGWDAGRKQGIEEAARKANGCRGGEFARAISRQIRALLEEK